MTVVPIIKRDYICKLAEQGKRIDGRKFDEYRQIEIEINVVNKAEGSAKVKIGNTQVLAGIKMDVGEPYSDSPDSGVLTTAAELIPMASPDFEVVEIDKLCIEPGEKVWIIFIDIHILDYDGNLFDAASLAALAALFTTNVPVERFRSDLEKLQEKFPAVKNYLKEHQKDYPLPLKEPPISCTSVKFNDVVVLDPSLDEEEIADARLTVATDKDGDIRAMQKGLRGSFTKDEIQKVIKASIDNGREIRKQLYKIIEK